MFFQEVTQQQGFSELTKLVIIAAIGVASNGITGGIAFYLARSKNKSETVKNLADAHKSEADARLSDAAADKTKADTLIALNNELDDVIVEVLKLRQQVRDLSDTEAKWGKEKKVIRDEIKTIAYRLRGVVDIMNARKIAASLRQDMVGILESLFDLALRLKPKRAED